MNKWFALFVIIISYNIHASKITTKNLSYFNSNDIPGSLIVYTEINDERKIKLLNNKVKMVENPECDKIINYRARFVIDGPIKININDFDNENTYNKLNRKTKFKRIGRLKFKGKRPSFPLNVEFDLKVDVQDKNFGNRKENVVLSETLKHDEPVLTFSEYMDNYNRFITHTHFHVGVFKISKDKYLIEVFGNLGLKSSMPNFIQNKMKDNYKNKLLHFSKVFKEFLLI
jgi:hypothetical protein